MLIADIHLTGRIIADLNHRQHRAGFCFGNFPRQIFSDFQSLLFPVNNNRRHLIILPAVKFPPSERHQFL